MTWNWQEQSCKLELKQKRGHETWLTLSYQMFLFAPLDSPSTFSHPVFSPRADLCGLSLRLLVRFGSGEPGWSRRCRGKTEVRVFIPPISATPPPRPDHLEWAVLLSQRAHSSTQSNQLYAYFSGWQSLLLHLFLIVQPLLFRPEFHPLWFC